MPWGHALGALPDDLYLLLHVCEGVGKGHPARLAHAQKRITWRFPAFHFFTFLRRSQASVHKFDSPLLL